MVKDSEPGIKKLPIKDCEYQHDETSLLANGWKKIFEDQFDQNLSNWRIWKSGAYNHELQLYQPSNLVIHDGILAIEAKKEQLVGFKFPNNKTKVNFEYSSGRIESKQLFSINDKYLKLRIMARIKLPLGYGLWPAFWAYGTPYPSQGEIDFMEARGAEPQKYHRHIRRTQRLEVRAGLLRSLALVEPRPVLLGPAPECSPHSLPIRHAH